MAISHTAYGDGAKILARARGRITGAGGRMQGDEKAGSFSVKGFEGTYDVGDGWVEIRVTDKPFFVPEEAVKSWLAANVKA
jgi:hypothetical protein